MFKSIEYKLFLYICLLIAAVAAATFFFIRAEYVYAVSSVFVVLLSLYKLYRHYLKFNQNILFLLNALDNGDYSFNFTEDRLSQREKELNRMMNRIKDILSKARKEVIENEKYLSLIVESVSTGIIILNKDNNIMTTNSAVNQILGLPVFTHLNQLNVIDKTLPDIFRSIEPGNATSLKIANEREEKQISIQASKITMKKGVMKIVTLSNIGNELEAKEMESWIRLIRVMTHEIMNSIAPITSLTETLLFSYKAKQNASNDESVQNTIEALDTINTTAKGLITFVESYRKFTGIPKPQLQDIDLIPLLEKTVLLSSYEIKGKEIEIEIRPHAPSYMLKADEAQITQILVNLIKNGIEAIHKDKKGTIVIKTTETDNRINIDVSNNGEPIADDIAPHIFIPFFTTKESGNGIGLSVSRYIMRLHGGNLKHYTKDGWTVFSMSF